MKYFRTCETHVDYIRYIFISVVIPLRLPDLIYAKTPNPLPLTHVILTPQIQYIDRTSGYVCNVIYMTLCDKNSCKENKYIGETGRNLKFRLENHWGYGNNNVTSQATALGHISITQVTHNFSVVFVWSYLTKVQVILSANAIRNGRSPKPLRFQRFPICQKNLWSSEMNPK